jgi:fumarate reductase (CoM/CoB) subunit B
MSRTLPMLKQREAETKLCTYCPKLCRPACPVATVEGRESVTPWGIMRGLNEVVRTSVTDDEGVESRLRAAYACTGCGGCESLCLLDNRVADTVRDARSEAWAQGWAPSAARSVVATFDRRLARIEAASSDIKTKGISSGRGETAWFPGCTATVFETDEQEAVARAVARVAPDGGCTVVTDTCCGAPLLDAGDREGFLKHARRLAIDLGNFQRLVVGDAGCAHTLKVAYTSLGVAAPRWKSVEHVSELFARVTHLVRQQQETRTVIFHDSCKLGRGLHVYDPPRKVIEALTGRAPTELPRHRERGICSGAGGLLPKTHPGTSKAVRRELVDEVREVAAGRDVVVITGCASTRRALRAEGVAAEDLSVWVARALTHNTTT